MAASSSPAALFFLCLLGLLSVASCQSFGGPVVTSVSGCVDVGATTLNCTFPSYITVRGSGFLANASSVTGASYANQPAYWITPRLELSAQAVAASVTVPAFNVRPSPFFPVNDSYFVFELGYLGRGVYAEGVPLSLVVSLGEVTLARQGRQSSSAPFTALSITSVPPPVIDTISGCPVVGADGLSVAQCLPDLDTLTLTGSGFLQWQKTSLQLHIGAVQTQLYLTLPQGDDAYDYIYNDTLLTVVLDNAYRYLLAAHDFGAPPQPLYVQEALLGWQSRRMSIQLAPLPLPSVSSVRRSLSTASRCCPAARGESTKAASSTARRATRASPCRATTCTRRRGLWAGSP